MGYFFKVPVEAILQPDESLILSFVLVFEIDSNLILFVFQLFDKISESLIQVPDLLTQELMELLTGLFEQIEVIFGQPPRIHYHLTKIGDVLLDGVSHFFDGHHMMAIVLIVHASCAYRLRALFAEVFYTFVLVPVAWDD